MARKLSEKQLQILRYMATQRDGAYALWIAEGCGNYYNTEWASSSLTTLRRRGFVECPTRGWYVLTEAGRSAIGRSGL